MTMTEALTSVTGRTITRPITSVADSQIDDVYGEDGEDGDEDADDDDDDNAGDTGKEEVFKSTV